MRFLKSTRQEMVAHAKAVQKYPFGLLNRSFQLGSHKKEFSNPYPIILIHGVIHNRSAFFPLHKEMKSWGWKNIVSMNYKTRHGSLLSMVEDLANVVDEVLAATQAQKVDIVGHSLGGLVARYFMTHNLGRDRVRKLITLGTIHNGMNHKSFCLKLLSKGSLTRDLRSESFFIKGLQHSQISNGSEITSIYSSSDLVAGGKSQCYIEGPAYLYKNKEVNVAGHLSLLYDQQVYKIIRKILGQIAFN